MSARDRLLFGLADLSVPRPYRLSEWQRRTVTALLEGLVRSVETELRAALSPAFAAREALHASLSSAHVEIGMPLLADVSPWQPELIFALLRRAEEHRLYRAGGDHALLIELAGDSDEDVAAEAMSLLIAQSGRFDAFHEPMMLRAELPAELEHGLVWTVAASLRRYITGVHGIGPAEVDAAVAAAALALLGDYDEGQTFASRSLRLMRRLDRQGRLDDEAVLRALLEGGLPLFLAALSVRSGVDADSAWELLSDPDARGGALLLRASAVGKTEAGAILFQLHGEGEAVASELDRFDTLSRDEAGDLLLLWRTDPAYRAAVARVTA